MPEGRHRPGLAAWRPQRPAKNPCARAGRAGPSLRQRCSESHPCPVTTSSAGRRSPLPAPRQVGVKRSPAGAAIRPRQSDDSLTEGPLSALENARGSACKRGCFLGTGRPSGEGVLDLPRARILVGCSAHNGCAASVEARYEYDEWAQALNPGWSADEVVPLLDWVRDGFRGRYTMDELTPPVATGLPFADDLDDLEAAEGKDEKLPQHSRHAPTRRSSLRRAKP